MASAQNAFFGELMGAFRAAVERSCGLGVEVAVDHYPPVEDDVVYVVVPHEYYPLTEPRAHPRPSQLARSIAVCTEQPGTPWFDVAAEIAASCGATVDINPLGVQGLRARGITAHLIQLGYIPEWDHWRSAQSPRPIDVTFLGGASSRRGSALASCGSVLKGRRAALQLVDTSRPHAADSPQYLAGKRKWEHLAASKTMINIHRDELAYFEWVRAVEAMLNGCVLITEHSIGSGPLVPGEHFVSCDLQRLPYVVEGLLDDDARLAEIRDTAYAMLRERLRLDTAIEKLAEIASTVLARAPTDRERPRRGAYVASKPLPAPPTEYERVLGDRLNEQVLLRMAVKRILLEQRKILRALTTSDVAEGIEDELRDVHVFGTQLGTKPRVSVLVSLFNYEHQVWGAVESVSLSTLRDIEVVVVDDGSTDRSAEVIIDAFNAMPWLRGKLLCRHENRGLPAARNLAASYAQADLVFILDADNTIYPHALERLAAALDENPSASFAYGLLEQRTPAGATGLLSWQAWDPRLLRYGNFVDAMAMIRRADLLAVDGFSLDHRLHGWEDFALWCAFAQAGRYGVRIPEIVGQYVVAGHSMISLTNIDASEAWTALARRFPFLTEPADAPVARAL